MKYCKTACCLIMSLTLILFSCDKVKRVGNREGWTIENDGTYSLRYGGICLTGNYPSIDGMTVHPEKTRIRRTASGGTINYSLEKGSIQLILGKDSTGFTITSSLMGFEPAPDWFLPLASARVSGADRFYKQGFGFAGASGVFSVPRPIKRIESARLKENTWSYDSYLFTGLIGKSDSTLVFSAYDNREYQYRSTLYNRQHRIGLIDRHLDTDDVFFESGFALEGIGLPDQTTPMPVIHIAAGGAPFGTLHRQAMNLADFNHVKLKKSPRYYYCSWYEFNSTFSMDILRELLGGISHMENPPGIQAIQIDDGYSWKGDWLHSNVLWPGGMQVAAREITEAGFGAGIWVGPFMVSSNSFIFKDHKDWIMKDNNGNMMCEMERPGEKVYILDTSHPDAFAYLQKVFRTFREMGFTTYKTDFMDWGLQDSEKVKRYTPGKTSVQYFMDVVRMIREEIGPDSYWLGCISPFGQMVGFADGIRVSNDVGDRWSRESTGNMFREMYAGQFFNNVLWQNDPDVLYLRDYSTGLSETEKYSIALYDGIMGGTITTSCRFPTLRKKDLALWHFLYPGKEHETARIPGWGIFPDVVQVVRDYPEQDAKGLLLVNTSGKTLEQLLSLQDLTGIDTAVVYSWGPGYSVEEGNVSQITVTLRSHESKLFYISRDGDSPPENLTIGGYLP